MQMHWLVQTLPWRPCAKSLLQISAYFWAFSKGLGQPAAHMRSLARAFAQRVNVSAANTLNACVKLSWCLVCQCKQWNICKGCSDVCSHSKTSPILWDNCTYLTCIQYWLKPASASVQSCKSIYCLHTVYLSHMHIHVNIFNMQTQLSSRLQFYFWCIKVLCARIERACENVWMVKLIWVFTGYTSVTNLPMRILKYFLHAWPKKAHVILASCAVSSEHSTARRLIALIARASNPSLTLCTLGNISCICWRLLPFFKINFFFVWVQTACIGYQQVCYASKERVKRTCPTIHWG